MIGHSWIEFNNSTVESPNCLLGFYDSARDPCSDENLERVM